MNILYLHTHDTGKYIEPYGHAIPTPHLLALAREGTIFRNAFSAAPTCSPSRAALLTGVSPHSCGMLGLAHRGFHLNDYSRHLVQVLNGSGRETVLCGIQHEAPQAELLGYQRILGQQGYVMRDLMQDPNFSPAQWDLANAERVADYLRSAGDGPFFVSFGMFTTHRPYPPAGEAVNPNHVLLPPMLHDTPENRNDMADFIQAARVLDQCVGKVLHALAESGRDRDTLVLFTTDHGIPFPESKSALYDSGIGVSLILRYPGNPRAGQAVDALVSQLDLFPTICDLVGVERPAWLQGRSLLPLLRGESPAIREEIFAEMTFHSAYEPMRCIRTERYKLILRFDDHGRTVPANIDDCPSKSFLIEHGYLREHQEPQLLFDLFLDPLERVNRIHDAAYGALYQDLRRRLKEWMRQTDDPLLAGRVPKPPGAKINKVTSVSSLTDDFE